jgi:hypothetical protein
VDNHFQMNFSDVRRQGPAIVRFESGTSDQEQRPMRAHPTCDMPSLSIFRPLGQRADWRTGLFKLYLPSDSPVEDEFKKLSERDAHEIMIETDDSRRGQDLYSTIAELGRSDRLARIFRASDVSRHRFAIGLSRSGQNN